MKKIYLCFLCLRFLGNDAVAFQSLSKSHYWMRSALTASYLDSLQLSPEGKSQRSTHRTSYFYGAKSSPAKTASSLNTGTGLPYSSSLVEPPTEETYVPSYPPESVAVGGFSHATIEYFALDKLTSKGPRSTADWGQPQDATRKLADDGALRAGSWFCSEGGWPSPNQKAHTEIFFVLDGHGCLGDADGVRHYFGPGDTVIIPKGHIGRWDVFNPIHKVWAVNAHDHVEETSSPIRVQVDHYHRFAPQNLQKNSGADPLYGSFSKSISSHVFYNVGPTQVGIWTCTPESLKVSNTAKCFFHLLEGIMFVTDAATGNARRCVAGDTVMLPAGWSGYIDVIETAKKLWTTAT